MTNGKMIDKFDDSERSRPYRVRCQTMNRVVGYCDRHGEAEALIEDAVNFDKFSGSYIGNYTIESRGQDGWSRASMEGGA